MYTYLSGEMSSDLSKIPIRPLGTYLSSKYSTEYFSYEYQQRPKSTDGVLCTVQYLPT